MTSPESTTALTGRTRIGDRQRDRLAIVYVRQSSFTNPLMLSGLRGGSNTRRPGS